MHSGYNPNSGSGHAFVIDGYDSNGLYHVNWGWGGSYDGYFQLNNLNPGSRTYNMNQQLIIGISPNIIPSYTLSLDAAIASPSTVNIGNSITVSSTIKNTGTISASGIIGSLKWLCPMLQV
jgi:hypothetical protein